MAHNKVMLYMCVCPHIGWLLHFIMETSASDYYKIEFITLTVLMTETVKTRLKIFKKSAYNREQLKQPDLDEHNFCKEENTLR